MKMEMQGSAVLRELREDPEQTPPPQVSGGGKPADTWHQDEELAAITKRALRPLAALTVHCSQRSLYEQETDFKE